LSTVTIPAGGQRSLFLDEIADFSALGTYTGLLRITAAGSGVHIVGLRGRTNERGEFLISTVAPIDETSPVLPIESVAAQLVLGQGYSTTIVCFGYTDSGATGILTLATSSGANIAPQILLVPFQKPKALGIP
jgi:hypothetical protein